MDSLTLVTVVVGAISVVLLLAVFFNSNGSSGKSSLDQSGDSFLSQMQNVYNFSMPKEVDEYEDLKSKVDPSTPDGKKQLCGALMKRTIALLPLIQQIQNDHGGMSKLRSKNMIRDSLYNSFLAAENKHVKQAAVQQEIGDIQEEAQSLRPEDDWGHAIFQQAAQFHQHMMRQQAQQQAQQQQQSQAAEE